MNLVDLCRRIENESFVTSFGCVKRVRGDSLRVSLPHTRVGALCEVATGDGPVSVEIVSLDPQGHVAMPLDELGPVRLGNRVFPRENQALLPAGESLLGRVVDSLGRPYDGGAALVLPDRVPLYGEKLNPLDRELIREPLDLGVRSVNACLTCGKGQRQGIFAGSGVGKSVLLGMMARFTAADVVVIALLGERGREVREFLERELGEEGRRKSVVVVETADKSPVRRVRCAFSATAIAEYFRSRGKHVLLLMDSLTRFAMAQREVGLAAGEPPTTKGYTPSVFARLAKLVERAGNWGERGSITGLYTVLVEADDLEDPVCDSARSILDGHIVLSRKLANRADFPAVDVLASVSRVMDQVVDAEHVRLGRRVKELLARYYDNEDAIHYGMYQRGSDAGVDECIAAEPRIRNLLRQDRDERADLGSSERALNEVFTS